MNRSRSVGKQNTSNVANIRMASSSASNAMTNTRTPTVVNSRALSSSSSSLKSTLKTGISVTTTKHANKTRTMGSAHKTTVTSQIRTITTTFSVGHPTRQMIQQHSGNSMVVAKKAMTAQPRRMMAAMPTQGNVGDVIGFPLADIGEGITEVEVLQWFVSPGDKIEQFQKVCEVQSDKANVEITSRYDGVVESLEYDVGTMAKVGQPLIKVKLTTATANAPVKKETAAATETAKTVDAAATSGTESAVLSTPKANNNVLASPVVRRMASEFGIELGRVRGTGKLGQITKDDLLKYQQETSGGKTTCSASAAPTPTSTPSKAPVAPSAAVEAPKKTVAIPQRAPGQAQDTVIPVTGIQRVMVKTMTAAAAIPTFGYSDEICVDNLVSLRKQLVERASSHGVKLSYFAFIIKALSLALEKYPQVNAHANDDCSEITQKGAHNIGLAMDTPRGLLVPNIKNVQDKSILQIASELNRLQNLGAAGKLSTDDLKGGTITLSNIGTIGGTYCTPILVVPEVAIGALGKFYQKAAFKPDGTVYPSTVMNIGWTADHRALDGATVARFSNEMKNYIENPQEMMLY